MSGRLLATGSDPGQRGGTVDIGTIGTWDGTLNADGSEHLSASGTIEFDIGAVIDVSGGSFAGLAGGAVNLRAPIMGGTVNVVISPGAIITGARSVVLEAYKTWNTKSGSGFDGIIDPEGWFTSNGTLVAGSFTNASGNLLATWNGTTLTNDDGTTNDLAYYLASDIFTPTAVNSAHVDFYNSKLVAFVQNPGVNAGPFSGIANFHLRPGVSVR